MTSFQIRRLTGDDWPAYRAIRLAALAESPSAFGSNLAREQQFTEQVWRSRLSCAAFAAEQNGRLLGIATGLPTAIEGTAVLVGMWVAPEARRQGIGEALVQHVIAWAREAGFSRLKLSVTVGNSAAEQLYLQCGFIHTDRAEWEKPDEEDRTVTMVREVGGGG